MRWPLVSVIALAMMVSVVGCRDDDDGLGGTDGGVADGSKRTGDGTQAGDGNVGAGEIVNIADVKTKVVASGAHVTIKGAIVTAVDTGGKYTGDVYIQDAAGTANGGVRIFGSPALAGGGQSSDLRPGDTVDVVGDVVHFAGPDSGKFKDGKVIVQINNALITKTGVGAAPTPKVLTAADLTDSAKAEQWEGMLVSVVGQETGATAVDGHGQYRMSGGLEVGSDLFEHQPTATKCVDITGIVLYFYRYRIHPRDAADIADSTSCVAPKSLSISEIQKGDATDKDPVIVEGVISAVDGKPKSSGLHKGFWIQQTATAAPWEGIYVYHQWMSTDALKPPTVGTPVKIRGMYTEFHGLSQISDLISIESTGAEGAITPLVADPSALATGSATFEEYEGVLVTIKNVKAGKSLDNGKTGADLFHYGFTLEGVEVDIKADLHEFVGKTGVAAGTEYSEITGVVHWSYDRAIIMPRTAADLTLK